MATKTTTSEVCMRSSQTEPETEPSQKPLTGEVLEARSNVKDGARPDISNLHAAFGWIMKEHYSMYGYSIPSLSLI